MSREPGDERPIGTHRDTEDLREVDAEVYYWSHDSCKMGQTHVEAGLHDGLQKIEQRDEERDELDNDVIKSQR